MIQKKLLYTNNQPQQFQTWEKTAFTALFKQLPYIYFNTRSRANISVYTPLILGFFLSCHYRLAESFFTPNLIDIFGYETPSRPINLQLDNNNNKKKNSHTPLEKLAAVTIVLISIYYFSIAKKCIFSLTNVHKSNMCKKDLTTNSKAVSIELFFKNAIWLERELREMLGVFLNFKNDNRCLLLLYGSSDFPIQKLFPTQGHRELYYNKSTNSITVTPLGAQF